MVSATSCGWWLDLGVPWSSVCAALVPAQADVDHEEVAHGDQARDGHHGEAQPETEKMESGELSAAGSL